MTKLRVALFALLMTTVAMAGCAGLETAEQDHDHGADDHSHGEMGDGMDMDDGMAHMHDSYDVPAGEPQPAVAIEVLEDPKSGYNVHIMATDFTFTPEDASTDHVPGTGHAHIYVDDVKIGRVYGDWYYLGGVSPGEHTVKVNLNTNGHAAYVVDGTPVEASVTITVPEPGEGMSHMHPDPHEAPGPMTVSLEVTPDPMSGYNLHIAYDGFTFTPGAASTEHVAGEGHAHIYIDGVKLTRLYGDWYHIGLESGEHEIVVELNGNDHVAYLVDGVPVKASTMITVA